MIATAGARLVEASIDVRPTTRTKWIAIWGGSHDGELSPATGEAELLEDRAGGRLGLPAGDEG